MAHKLIEAAKAAVLVARCDHDLIPVPKSAEPSGFHRTMCRKCGASFYEPVPNGDGA